ncbi:TIGR03086 family protein [Rhodococcus rhodnii]|uniref:Mycothiol-dependent maleylpyruvate isomerase metal-binding domain-containing protein n=2 Tax=Rhodococcus rhodnii TaxID=38312 RepID=R7WQV0_9NOCA|nr:TIGR03086 family metal-binding protein [Rhodococcus rhodnii]EOM77693.1 hypothetical protein Rrhod_0934 [Rhodococcus rhodnii LMG 5362]TXG89347.1 TIGR03086 family protein [Rhodococcus rhodnii]
MHDLRDATAALSALTARTSDAALDAETPCDRSVAWLLDHIAGLSLAFTLAATKTRSDLIDRPPTPSEVALDPDWRRVIPERLDTLAEAWRAPEAWEGTTRVGGVDLPAAVAATVALDELVLHGWDLAVATGSPFAVAPADLDVVHDFVLESAAPGAPRDGIFGPVVAVAADAPRLDRVLGLAGRDPGWEPGRS